MDEFKSNSHKSKETTEGERRMEKVVTGSVRPKKKTNAEKLAELFLPEDVDNFKTYILRDILIPAGKKTLSEIVDIFLYGSAGRNKKTTNASKVSYRAYYDEANGRRDSAPVRPKQSYSYDDVVFNNRPDAEEVLMSLEECIGLYGHVSVRDFYDAVGITGNYTDHNYGWTDLHTAKIVRLTDGDYTIKLPRAIPLK